MRIGRRWRAGPRNTPEAEPRDAKSSPADLGGVGGAHASPFQVQSERRFGQQLSTNAQPSATADLDRAWPESDDPETSKRRETSRLVSMIEEAQIER